MTTKKSTGKRKGMSEDRFTAQPSNITNLRRVTTTTRKAKRAGK